MLMALCRVHYRLCRPSWIRKISTTSSSTLKTIWLGHNRKKCDEKVWKREREKERPVGQFITNLQRCLVPISPQLGGNSFFQVSISDARFNWLLQEIWQGRKQIPGSIDSTSTSVFCFCLLFPSSFRFLNLIGPFWHRVRSIPYPEIWNKTLKKITKNIPEPILTNLKGKGAGKWRASTPLPPIDPTRKHKFQPR